MLILIGILIVGMIIFKDSEDIAIIFGIAIAVAIVMAFVKGASQKETLKRNNIQSGGHWSAKYLGGLQQIPTDRPFESTLVIDNNTDNLVCIIDKGYEKSTVFVPFCKIQSATVESKESSSVNKFLLLFFLTYEVKGATTYLQIDCVNNFGEIDQVMFETASAAVAAAVIMKKRYDILEQSHNNEMVEAASIV